jgi:transcriptional regulator with XRE-family HTH domain
MLKRAARMTVNPDILTWARDTAGLSADDAARVLGFSDTRNRSAAERLRALEAGDEEPSRSVLLRMAKAYRRSLLVFYLSAPPERAIGVRISAPSRVPRPRYTIPFSTL